jgi:L-rhamnose isomerase
MRRSPRRFWSIQTALETAQREGDVLEANSVLKDAYETDANPEGTEC